MKILLIETSRTYHGKSKGVRLSLPLGLLYMGAVLEEEGFEVSLFNSLVCSKTRVKEIPGFLHHGVDDDYFKDRLHVAFSIRLYLFLISIIKIDRID